MHNKLFEKFLSYFNYGIIKYYNPEIIKKIFESQLDDEYKNKYIFITSHILTFLTSEKILYVVAYGYDYYKSDEIKKIYKIKYDKKQKMIYIKTIGGDNKKYKIPKNGTLEDLQIEK